MSKYAARTLTVYESLLEFESFIQLAQQNLTDEFVKGILSRARAKFFTRGNDESLFYKADLYRVLIEKYKSQLEAPSEPTYIFSIPGQNVSPIWQRAGKESCLIGRPEFVKLMSQTSIIGQRKSFFLGFSKELEGGLLSKRQSTRKLCL